MAAGGEDRSYRRDRAISGIGHLAVRYLFSIHPSCLFVSPIHQNRTKPEFGQSIWEAAERPAQTLSGLSAMPPTSPDLEEGEIEEAARPEEQGGGRPAPVPPQGGAAERKKKKKKEKKTERERLATLGPAAGAGGDGEEGTPVADGKGYYDIYGKDVRTESGQGWRAAWHAMPGAPQA